MLGHQRHRLFVADLALVQTQLAVDRLSLPEQLAGRDAGAADELTQLVARQRLDVKIDALVVDPAPVEDFGELAARAARALLVDDQIGHANTVARSGLRTGRAAPAPTQGRRLIATATVLELAPSGVGALGVPMHPSCNRSGRVRSCWSSGTTACG